MDFEIIRSEVKQILMTLVVNHKDKVTPSYLRLLLHCVLSDLKEIQKTKTIKKMHLSNKKRLLSIICANLLFFLGESLAYLTQDDFPEEIDVIGNIYFNQTDIPTQMYDCEFTDVNRMDVICDGSKWIEGINQTQLPDQVRSLKIQNFACRNLKEEDFTDTLIYSLEIRDSDSFAKIQKTAFSYLKSTLQFLKISNTSLNLKNQTVFGNFADLKALRHLILEDNQLISIEDEGQEQSHLHLLTNLEYLSFQRSDLQTLRMDVFEPLRTSMKLKHLNLQDCNLSWIAANAFEYLPYIEHIDFKGNPKLLALDWQHVPFPITLGSIESKSFQNLGLANMGIMYSPFFYLIKFQNELKRLDLSGNSFGALGHLSNLFSMPFFPDMRVLQELDLHSNGILSIHESTFLPLSYLRKLDLSQNVLTGVPKSVALPELEILDLSYQYSVMFTVANGAFTTPYKSKLRELYMNFNRLDRIKASSFLGLGLLQHLEITNSPTFKHLEEDCFWHLKSLKSLNLSYNYELRGMSETILQDLTQLESLDVQYSHYIFEEDTPKGKRNHQTTHTLRLLKNLKYLNIRCALNPFCTSDDSYDSPIDISYLEGMEDLEELDLSMNGLAEWNEDRFVKNKKLKKLYLYHNRMSHLTRGLLESFSRLEVLDFRENTGLECDQQIVDFVDLVNATKSLAVVGWEDGYGYKCRNTSTLELIAFRAYYDWFTSIEIVDEVSESGIPWLLIILSSGVFAFIGAIIGYFIHRERFVLTYKLLMAWHKLQNPADADAATNVKSAEHQKQYDVFVSYSHEDEEWVKSELLLEMEVKRDLKCCIHERDFEVGVTVLQNIVNCVDKSRVFIVILSPAYLSSTWCMFELFLAQSRLNYFNSNLIVIVKQKPKSKQRLDKKVQMMLKLWTYLEWPQSDHREYFWKRLAACISHISHA